MAYDYSHGKLDPTPTPIWRATTTGISMVLNTPQQIETARLLTLKAAVRLESLGMKRRGPAAAVIARKECGLPARAPYAVVIAELQARIDSANA